MAKITPGEISKMAEEIKVFLTDWGLAKDVTIFYNGIRCVREENADGSSVWKEEPGLPQVHGDHVAIDHILTILDEETLLWCILNEVDYDEEGIYTPEKVRNFPPHIRQKICERLPRAEYLWKYREEYLEKICTEYSHEIARLKEAMDFLEPSDYNNYEDYLTEKQEFESELEDMLSDIAELEHEMGVSDILILSAEEVLQTSGRDSADYFWLDDAEELLEDLTGGTDKLMRKIEDMAKHEFDAIFDRYHVQYLYGTSWNLTCFEDNRDVYLDFLYALR